MTFEKLAAEIEESVRGHNEGTLYIVGRMNRALSHIAYAAVDLKNDPDDVRDETCYTDIEFWLEDLARSAVIFLKKITHSSPTRLFVEEYERAAKKHPGMTLDSDKHTYESCFYAIAEEVGEVAAALTYDNTAGTGHNAELVSEVTQVGGLAIAWLMRYQSGGKQ